MDLEILFSIKFSGKGPNSMFSLQGKIALIVLKYYACYSDRKLIEQRNSIWIISFLQYPSDLKRLSNYNYKIVGQMRTALFSKLHSGTIERILWARPLREGKTFNTE